MLAGVELIERVLFGSISPASSPEGLKAAGCPARLYHSDDDAIVSYEESFERVREVLSDRENISFVPMKGRNHDIFIPPENDKRQRSIRKELLKTQDPERIKALTDELWSLMSETDRELAEEFTTFFNDCLLSRCCFDKP